VTDSSAIELEPGLFRVIVLGEPVSWKRPEHNPRTGQTFVEATTARFRSVVREACRPIVDAPGFKLIEGPVELGCQFYYPRPKGWARWQHELADQGVLFFKPSGADLDNLFKGVQDAIQGVLIRNDRQVASYGPSGKIYDTRPRVEIMLRLLQSEHDLRQVWLARQPPKKAKPALPLLELLP
jgi:Holliday junction resolvase RusA-like endonuclease